MRSPLLIYLLCLCTLYLCPTLVQCTSHVEGDVNHRPSSSPGSGRDLDSIDEAAVSHEMEEKLQDAMLDYYEVMRKGLTPCEDCYNGGTKEGMKVEEKALEVYDHHVMELLKARKHVYEASVNLIDSRISDAQSKEGHYKKKKEDICN